MTDKIVRNDEPPIKITSVTIGIPHRCPTCGFYPPDFYKLLEFPRRVDELYIVPKKSRHYSARGWNSLCLWSIKAFTRRALSSDCRAKNLRRKSVAIKRTGGFTVKNCPYCEREGVEVEVSEMAPDYGVCSRCGRTVN